MKFSTKKDELIRAVGIASHLSTTRATLPILQNILLKTKTNKLIIRSTDLEQTLEIVVKGEVAEEGQITTPSRLLLEYIQNNTDSDITLETEDTTLLVHSLNHQAQIKGLPAEEYPVIPEIKPTQTATLKVETIKEAISQTLFATAHDDSRPILNGLLWRFDEKGLTVVGTDGYRLAYYTSLESQTNLKGDYILPKKTMQEVLKIAESGELRIDLSGNQVRFTTEGISLISRILEGVFPDYQAIIPKKTAQEVLLDSQALTQSLRLASLFSRDSAFSTKLNLATNKLTISAISPHLGESVNEVQLAETVTEPLIISLNAQYLLDALTQLTGPVRLRLTNNRSPIILESPKSSNFLYLLMPLRSE